jgi:endoglucanase
MKLNMHTIQQLNLLALAGLLAFPLAGCKSTADKSCCDKPSTPSLSSSVIAPSVPVEKPALVRPTIRIKAGVTAPFTDSSGNVWLADQGFADGDTIERPDLEIANTKDPGLYRAERYGMTSFSQPVPNGNYIVKLHFAETFEDITAPGGRVFSFNVEGKEFKDFDVFAKAGGALRAYVETVPVTVTDEKLDIRFTSQVENPEINAIEILPTN